MKVLWPTVFTLILSSCPPGADQAGEQDREIRSWVERLGSSEVSIREAATQALLARPPSDLPGLRRLLKDEADIEIKGRLTEIIRQVILREATSLYGEGELDRSLLKFAEAEGASDPGSFVTDRVKETKKQVEDLAAALGNRNPERTAQAIVKKNLGPWLMPVLLESLGQHLPERKIPAVQILTEIHQEAVPHLCRALRSPNKSLQSSACGTLYWMGARSHPKLQEALRFVRDDPDANPEAKELANKMLFLIDRDTPDRKK